MTTVESKAVRTRVAMRVALWLIQFLMATFFGFVGFMKAFAPMADLETWHAWVARLSPVLARGVGWSEMLCAVGLLLPGLMRRRQRLIALSALILLVNQIIAIGFHAQRGELSHALLQNLILIALLAVVWRGWRSAAAN